MFVLLAGKLPLQEKPCDQFQAEKIVVSYKFLRITLFVNYRFVVTAKAAGDALR
jgi:hypothetical protein